MPKGIPNSGQRRSRTQPAGPGLDPSDTAVAVHDPEVGDDAPPAVEAPTPPAPTPDDELTPEQLEIKRLRDRLAQSEGRKDVEPEIDDTAAVDGEVIIIHFLEDGATALGKVFYRGDALEFVVGSQAHKDTFDRNGKSWLDLRFDEFAQAERFQGRIMFRNGPWPGKTYADGTFQTLRSERDPNQNLKPPTEEELAAAEKARARRAAPKLPSMV